MSKQTVVLEDKAMLKISGVMGVKGLTETDAQVVLENDCMEIRGSNLKAEKLSVEDGELIIVGNIYSIKYSGVKEKKGFIKRIFK